MSYEAQSVLAVEKIPTREEVMRIFAGYVGDRASTIAYEQFDQYGPVLLDVEVAGSGPGESIQYQYMRKGEFSGQPTRSETTIHVVFYKDGIPGGGYNLARYNEETRNWEEQNKPA
ncbi:MAG: hypothetical protein RLZZ347_104 [Candidatus Parcubacteria bacterium]|jgi:hypothetical protein